MERKEFLSLVGLGSASVFAAICMGGCSKSAVTGGPTGVDFTIDLSQPAYASLANPGGYAYSSGIIIAHQLSGGYIAVSQACTHEAVTVKYQAANQRFFCSAHASAFSETGAAIAGPARSALTKYQTTLAGTNLRIYS